MGIVETELMERWRPVAGFEGAYEVSSHGRVKSLPRTTTKGGFLTPKIARKRGGYPVVGLVMNGKQSTRSIHSLVAEAFIGERLPGFDIRHIDGNPLNARVENLAYGSRSENNFDAVRHGTHANAAKTHCPQGHPYSAENTIVTPSRPNARYCRECHRARNRRIVNHPDFNEEWRP